MRSERVWIWCCAVLAVACMFSCTETTDSRRAGYVSMATGGDVAANRYYLTLSSYAINPRYLDEPGVALGDGIDLSDPFRPLLAPYRAFDVQVQASGRFFTLPKSSDVIEETAILRESLRESEEAQVLSAYFKASYGLVSANAAFETARTEQKSYHTIYALLEHSGEADRLPAAARHWSGPPASEGVADRDEALLTFVSSYGSHYVSAITYGLRIAVQGKLRKDGSTKASTFSAAFKGAFGNFSADAGTRLQQKKVLGSSDVELLLEATSGGHDGAGVLVLRGFDDIAEFLEKVKNDSIQFSVAPIELTLKPYWATLDRAWENTRALLNPATASFRVPAAPYGVPKGTIVAWAPTADYVRELKTDSLAKTIVPPPGWAICDGTMGTPDLTDRFVMGTGAYEEIGATGGTATHTHAVTAGTVARVSGLVTAGTSAVVKVAGEGTHIPPYAKLVYIMKLNDLP
ncbi:MAG: hypothetical protein JW876_10850 [Candidatus Krumholzibacteriota bacterium]|nr:hypothetical protein [Candidatus Krumholzibacteriota bacterium]